MSRRNAVPLQSATKRVCRRPPRVVVPSGELDTVSPAPVNPLKTRTVRIHVGDNIETTQAMLSMNIGLWMTEIKAAYGFHPDRGRIVCGTEHYGPHLSFADTPAAVLDFLGAVSIDPPLCAIGRFLVCVCLCLDGVGVFRLLVRPLISCVAAAARACVCIVYFMCVMCLPGVGRVRVMCL
jgi:hypothetical protein